MGPFCGKGADLRARAAKRASSQKDRLVLLLKAASRNYFTATEGVGDAIVLHGGI